MKSTKGCDVFFSIKWLIYQKKMYKSTRGIPQDIQQSSSQDMESKQQKSKGKYWRPSSIEEKD